MMTHTFHEGRALQAFDVSGPIIDIGRRHELPALLEAGD
jgi:hypothetical protein